MAEIIHRVGIKAVPDKEFRALSTIEGLAGWWTENTSGVAEVGKTIAFRFVIRRERSSVKWAWKC